MDFLLETPHCIAEHFNLLDKYGILLICQLQVPVKELGQLQASLCQLQVPMRMVHSRSCVV